MYNRIFKDEGETKTDKFKGLLIAFILGNVVIWMVPEIMAAMDGEPGCGAEHIGYLPDNVLTRGSSDTTSSPSSPSSPSVVPFRDGTGGLEGWHVHNWDDKDGNGAVDIGEGTIHPDHAGVGGAHDITVQNFPIELYDFFPPAYGQSGSGCPWETSSFASKTLHSIVQTILFVVKIVMVLGVVGAVGVMRFR